MGRLERERGGEREREEERGRKREKSIAIECGGLGPL